MRRCSSREGRTGLVSTASGASAPSRADAGVDGREHDDARGPRARPHLADPGRQIEPAERGIDDHEVDVVAALVLEGAARVAKVEGGADDHPAGLELLGEDPAHRLVAAGHQGEAALQRARRRRRPAAPAAA